ncbi:MAG: 3-isopropylmalate dehydratase large subunit [Desulfobacteraceae bacterium]|nr:3-isopropylmalate dehydratase large subunit [Desulfobacteraceae bacterium]
MGKTLIERILARHSEKDEIKPEEIIDIKIDTRAARDFGGANVVKNLENNNLSIEDPQKTFFTFDTNPGGSDQKYAANQQYCRMFARRNNIKVFDINMGIGTHQAIDSGLVWPGSTFVSTDSHSNIMGSVGAFGQGLGDKDMAAVWAYGSIWYKVPESVKLNFHGKRPENVTAKDIVLNLLSRFGASTLLGTAVEFSGDAVEELTLDERITIASMGTEMGAITLLFAPNEQILKTLKERSAKGYETIRADEDAVYSKEYDMDISLFEPMISCPGHPHDVTTFDKLKRTKIDSAFIGSCTNGRMEDLRAAGAILQNRKLAPGVVLKIVPSTDAIWRQAMDEGLIKTFKEAGALVSNAGCAGCAAGQVGQNGPGEVTVSTGNRNFAGKQGKGEVYLASPGVVAASAVAGYITTPDNIPEKPMTFESRQVYKKTKETENKKSEKYDRPTVVEGKTWFINVDDIDTDMIFHNKYLHITDMEEMGQYALDNLEGWEDFAQKASPGDIIITGKNFGAGSSRQQAVDCFKSLGISCILAESFGAIYERNAINAAMPVLTYVPEVLEEIDYEPGDRVQIDFKEGRIKNLKNNKSAAIDPFYDVQMEIYQRGGLLMQ